MSKRMGFQFRQPRSKMPKLDITISSSQRTVTSGPSNMNHQNKPPEAPAQSEDVWCDDDDDDDALLVLASQVADDFQAKAAAVISQSMNICDPDTSYNRFRQDVRPVHSTQMNAFDEFDNDEDIFSKVPDFVPNADRPGPSTENKENNGQNVQNHPSGPSDVRVSSNMAAREQKEKIQNEYLAEKNKALKKQIENLQAQLSKMNQRCTTKEGEASTLRYEVDSKNREIERLRKERMEEAGNTEKKYSEQITALEKKIETQRSELEFKNIDIMNKKSRRSLNDSVVADAEGSSSLSFDLHNLFKLNSSSITYTEESNIPAAKFLTAKGLEKYNGLVERDFDTLNCLNTLQSIYNGAKTQKLRSLDNHMMKEFTNITNAFIDSLKIYASRLEIRTPNKYNPGTESKILSEELAKNTAHNNLHGSSDGHLETTLLNEKLIYERQLLAVIAILCTDFQNTTPALLFEKCEDSSSYRAEDDAMDGENRIGSFVDILTDVFCTIGHAKNLSSHKSLIESASLLLVSLAKSFTPNSIGDLLLLNLFQAIVFCEPDLCSLAHLSEFLEIISENQSSNVCNRFCASEPNNIMSFQRYKIHRFSIDTCPLQVFSCLLQTAFQPYVNHDTMLQQTNEVITVTNITMRMILFLRNCFNRRVDWLFRKSRSSDESINAQVSYCYCYVVSCIIVLLHYCINSWTEMHKNEVANMPYLKMLKTIFSMGALFLYDIIKKNYEPKVLSLGGFPVKNRLQAIHDWIVSFHFPFRLSSISENAIQSVNLRRISQLNEPQMVSSEPQQQTPDKMDSILQDSFENFLL